MAERAVFLDRDDTILDNDGYLGDPSKVKLLPGAATALAAIRALGYRLIVVSNQSGVARGMFDEAAVQAVNDEMGRQIKEKGNTHLDASYYCPYHPEAKIPEYRVDHDWRKPKPGMLKQAAIDFRLELSQCWMVGDMDRDIAAGAAVGCRTILLNNPDLHRERNEKATVQPNFVVKTLADAARIIAREGKIPPPHAPTPVPAPASPPPVAPPAPRAESQIAAPSGPVAQFLPPPAPAPEATRVERPEIPPAPARPAADPARRESEPPPPFAGMTSLERNLDELLIQLRQQSRNADLRPDFSLSNMGALILQFLALATLGLGLVKLITQRATFTTQADYDLTVLSNLQAIAWITVAMVLQGIVIAIVVHARQK
jgi:D,D-heptose 1,7-bisphosphate phosphatase